MREYPGTGLLIHLKELFAIFVSSVISGKRGSSAVLFPGIMPDEAVMIKRFMVWISKAFPVSGWV